VGVAKSHQEPDRLPLSRPEAMKALGRHGMKGLHVHHVGEPLSESKGGDVRVRVYCLTRAQLALDNTMKRRAVTVVLELDGAGTSVRRLPGWIVCERPLRSRPGSAAP
jgi:hypothetical protein